ESNVPLFFDPYPTNRATGSFIVIDELSNATVGAGMIVEKTDGVAPHGRPDDPGLLCVPVTAAERFGRHGHTGGVLLIEDQPAIGMRLERLLFDQGFEVLHLLGNDVSPKTLVETIAMTQAAGIVVIYSGAALDERTKRLIAAGAEERIFDAATSEARRGDREQIERQALAFLQSLHFPGPLANLKEVD